MGIIIATLQSRPNVSGDIERGIKMYKKGLVEITERNDELKQYSAIVSGSNEDSIKRNVTFSLTKDGRDVLSLSCGCVGKYKTPPLCRHVIASILEIQDGIIETELVIGKTATVFSEVAENNTAKAMGSGLLNVYSTPSMVALMENAADKCLSDVITESEVTVGVKLDIEHTSASIVGTGINATAKVTGVYGRKVEFEVVACDEKGEIGNGKHTRVIVDRERFINSVKLSHRK